MSDETPAAGAAIPAPSTSPEQTQTPQTPAPAAATPETQQPAADPQAPGEPATASEGQPDGSEDESSKRNKKTAGQYISELKQQRNEAQAALARAQSEIERLRQPLEAPGPDATQDEIDRYNVKAAVRESRAEEAQQAAALAAEQTWQTMRATFEAKASAAADRMPGLVDKFLALPVVSHEVASFVSDSDKGAEVAFFLTQNPNEATRISRLPGYQQGIELARIEGRLQAAPQVRKVSNTPPPVPTMPGAPSPATKRLEDMSTAEYIEARKKAWNSKAG